MEKSVMIEKLKDYLPEKRWTHSLNVAKAAVQLADLVGCDSQKAEIAGILHDAAKYVKLADVGSYCEKYNIHLDDMEKKSTALSHSVLGSYIARYEFGIEDENILSAIRYHTTAKPDMNILEKIIYVADVIEVGRDYPGVDDLREVAFSGDLDRAVLMALENAILSVIRKKAPLHLRTIEARNYYLAQVKAK
jgi:hydrolase, HD family